jgi:hypothetical protein
MTTVRHAPHESVARELPIEGPAESSLSQAKS